MRVKAKKRKVVPILVRCPVAMEEYYNDPRKEGARCREEIERELGRKAYEFADKRFLRGGGHGIHEICVFLKVIDRGGANGNETKIRENTTYNFHRRYVPRCNCYENRKASGTITPNCK